MTTTTNPIPGPRDPRRDGRNSAAQTGQRPQRPTSQPLTLDERVQGLAAGQKSIDERVDGLTTAQQRHEQTLADTRLRLDQVGQRARKQNDRTMRLFTHLGERVAKDHDGLNQLQLRLEALEERVGNGRPFNLEAAMLGFTTDEIREMLTIAAEQELTPTSLLNGILRLLHTNRAEIQALIDAVAETRGIVNKHGDRLDKLDGPDGSVVRLEAALNRVTTTVADAIEAQDKKWYKTLTEGLQVRSVVTGKTLLSAALTTVIVWMAFWLIASNVAGKVYGTGNNAHTQIGTATYPWFWFGLCFGVIAGGIAFLIAEKREISLKKGRHEATSETTTASTNSHTTTTATAALRAAAPTQVLPTVPADAPQPAARS